MFLRKCVRFFSRIRVTLSVAVVVLPLSFLSTGCAATFLPSGQEIQKLPWKSYAEADKAYGEVQEGVSTIAELKALGFDLAKVSRSFEQNPIDTRNFLLGTNAAANKYTFLPFGAQKCLEQGASCITHIFPIIFQNSHEEGSVIKNKLGFEEQNRITGSSMKAFFFIRENDKVVVYKTRDNNPLINNLIIKKDPLGPLSNIIGSSMKVGKSLAPIP